MRFLLLLAASWHEAPAPAEFLAVPVVESSSVRAAVVLVDFVPSGVIGHARWGDAFVGGGFFWR